MDVGTGFDAYPIGNRLGALVNTNTNRLKGGPNMKKTIKQILAELNHLDTLERRLAQRRKQLNQWLKVAARRLRKEIVAERAKKKRRSK